MLRVRDEKTYNITTHLAHSKMLGENRFFIVDVLTLIGSGARIEIFQRIFQRFRDCFVLLLARNLEFT